jgi:hypothetical protein
VDDLDWGTLVGEDGSWSARAGYSPILSLTIGGEEEGSGWIEVWPNPPGAAVRETFRVRGDFDAKSIAFRAGWISGAGPLRARLESADGTVVEQADLPAETFRMPPLEDGWEQGVGVWGTFRFAGERVFPQGSAWRLVLEPPPGSEWRFLALREGTDYGFGPGAVFPEGSAEVGRDGAWAGWPWYGDAANGPSDEADLPFYLPAEK